MYHNILVPISFETERDTSAPLKRWLSYWLRRTRRLHCLHVVEHIPNYAISVYARRIPDRSA